MFIDENREVITSDLYNIASRLKAIDNGYFVIRNHGTHKFEVHNKNQIGNSYCLTVPFPILDERTINFVNKTRIQYMNKIVADIEKNNKKIEMEAKNKINDYCGDTLKGIHRYVTSHESKDTIDKDSELLKERN